MSTEVVDHIDHIIRGYMLIGVAAYFILPLVSQLLSGIVNALLVKIYSSYIAEAMASKINRDK
jgi:hypothetical protein